MASSNANSVSPGGSSNDTRARSPEADSDGKSSSLPHLKRGPYQCPRCHGLLATSQALASHVKYICRSKRTDNKRRKSQTKRTPYRANLIRAGGEPDDYGSSTHENKEAEAKKPSEECTNVRENKNS